jgi:hypothetical protein
VNRGLPARAVCLALASALVLPLGCAKSEETYAPPEYKAWKKTTDVVLNYPIPGHMDRYRIPRMNAVGFGAKPSIVGGKAHWDFPEDTAIVKEVYATSKPAPGEQPVQLTIMYKEPGDKRAQGGWLWLTRDLPDGKETVFTGNFCITCHSNANEAHPYGDGNPNEEFRDYVYFVPGEVPLPAKIPSH